jgi:hypothetical protein
MILKKEANKPNGYREQPTRVAVSVRFEQSDSEPQLPRKTFKGAPKHADISYGNDSFRKLDLGKLLVFGGRVCDSFPLRRVRNANWLVNPR